MPQFQSADAFGKFSAAISKVVAVQSEMAVVDVVAMYSSLMAFALQVHREQLSFVDIVLAGCAAALESRGKVSDSKARRCCAAVPRQLLHRGSSRPRGVRCRPPSSW